MPGKGPNMDIAFELPRQHNVRPHTAALESIETFDLEFVTTIWPNGRVQQYRMILDEHASGGGSSKTLEKGGTCATSCSATSLCLISSH